MRERRCVRAPCSWEIEEVTVLYLDFILLALLIDRLSNLIALQLCHNLVLSLLECLLVDAVDLQNVVAACFPNRIGDLTRLQLENRIADLLGKPLGREYTELAAFIGRCF